MHYQAEILADRLCAYGVNDIFVSPGSRNAPLLEAMAARQELNVRATSPDERVAAFVALGYASASMRPVALVCTSGSAVLNYAPAVAEAYYRRIPMVIVSADRPQAYIDQDDSQTVRQPGLLGGIVKKSVDVGMVSTDMSENEWVADRDISDAIMTATDGPAGPVHINIHIGASTAEPSFRRRGQGLIELVRSRSDIEVSRARELARRLAPPRKVLVVCAVGNPDGRLNKAIGRMGDIANVAVVAEPVANVHGRCVVTNPDMALAACPDQDWLERLRPDVVITLGGAVISARIKQYLRKSPNVEHWQVGFRDSTVDCFGRLVLRAQMDPGQFMQQLAAAMRPYAGSDGGMSYREDWETASRRAYSRIQSLAARAPWSDFKAMSVIAGGINRRWNVELSNGTTVRYACALGLGAVHRCGCNRGVSGIDGSTSTAVGVAMAYRSDITLLITGDMSALYDMGGLAVADMPQRFRMIVLDNGGGGIFRSIPATRQLSVRTDMLSMDGMSLPLAQLSAGFGLDYFEASSEQELRSQWQAFAEAPRSAIMRVITPAAESAEVYASLFDKFLF